MCICVWKWILFEHFWVLKDSWFFAKLSKLQELFRILFCWPKKNVFPILKVFGINWSYIENSEKNICACLSRHETNFGATLSGSTYLIPTSLYSNSFARNLLMFKSGCIFLNFTLHSPALNISSETSSQKLGRHALHRVRSVWQSLG